MLSASPVVHGGRSGMFTGVITFLLVFGIIFALLATR